MPVNCGSTQYIDMHVKALILLQLRQQIISFSNVLKTQIKTSIKHWLTSSDGPRLRIYKLIYIY